MAKASPARARPSPVKTERKKGGGGGGEHNDRRKTERLPCHITLEINDALRRDDVWGL